MCETPLGDIPDDLGNHADGVDLDTAFKRFQYLATGRLT
jgi:hypothetical protein